MRLQSWPALDRRYLIDASGNEPVWRSATELLYTAQKRGILIAKRMRIAAASATSPVGTTEVLIADPRFTEPPPSATIMGSTIMGSESMSS